VRGAAYVRRLRNVFEYADTLVAVSECVSSQLVRLGAPAHKIRVHHIGIPVTAPAPEPGPRAGVVFVGRLVDVKGVGDLVAALGMLPAHLREGLPVTVVGSGPRLADLRRQADDAGIDVTFTGYLPPDEVAGVLRRSAIFCGPSKTSPDGDVEAFGMVFLEAALHGLPVVAYHHGGVSEAVDDGRTGLLAPEGDVPALADHVRRLLESPGEAAALGAAGRARVLAQFDVVQQTRLLEDLYDEVAARSTTRR
jgi:glycosyltransferase involved in cell wall biosynthesis